MQVGQLVQHLLLPAAGVTDDDLIQAVSSIVISNKFPGDTRCPAGMNALHFIAVQPQLLLRPGRNLAFKLMELVLKMGPDVNGQVRSLGCRCEPPRVFLCAMC